MTNSFLGVNIFEARINIQYINARGSPVVAIQRLTLLKDNNYTKWYEKEYPSERTYVVDTQKKIEHQGNYLKQKKKKKRNKAKQNKNTKYAKSI